MLARALIILLVVLNVGVATWWATRSDIVPAAIVAPPDDGVGRLQLLRETTLPVAARRPSPVSATTFPSSAIAAPDPVDHAATTTTATSERCYALGPFADAATSEAARKRLQPRTLRLHVRQVVPVQSRDWRVWLPPLADRATAQAMASRISAAGFDDYFIVAAGDEANSIALGRYRSEESARRREAALRAGGFAEARAEALGAALPAQTWIDIAVAAPLDAAERSALGAVRVESADCKTVP